MRWLMVGLILLAACGGSAGGAAERATPPPDQILGVITELHIEGDQVVGLEVETAADIYEVLIDPARDYGFNLNHLRSHRDQQLPVLVALEVKDGNLYAVSILDG